MSNKKYRIGLDLGSTSIGWSIIGLKDNEPNKIIKCGVRIVPDGRNDKDKTPLTVHRTEQRSIRRNRDRYLTRSKDIVRFLSQNGLFPSTMEKKEALKKLDPVLLRYRALDDKLDKFEIGRAIWHLSKKRGFKSNRKVDKADANESSVIKQAIARLKDKLEVQQCRTIGEYLYKLNQDLPINQQNKNKSQKFNNYKDKEDGIFPERSLIIHELEQIWSNQQSYYPELTDKLMSDLIDIIFRQRDLKAQLKGKCIFENDEDRSSKASPYFQEFRLLQLINSLRVSIIGGEQREFSKAERETLFKLLSSKKESKISAILTKLYGKKELPNYQLSKMKHDEKLKGNQTSAFLSGKKYFIKLWDSFELAKQDKIVEMMLNDKNDENVEKELLAFLGTLDISEEQQDNILHANLPTGYSNLSKKAILKILPFLREGHIYSEACKLAGYNHSGENIEPTYTTGNLPYYGEILKTHVTNIDPKSSKEEERLGKISNITVHLVLNQIRKLMNAIVKEYGVPEQIAIEITRDLPMSTQQRSDHNRKQDRNKRENERIANILLSEGVENSYSNRMRVKLWEELNIDSLKRTCIYTGVNIPISQLFSNEIQIEHILPFSKTFDDSYSNKTVSYRYANQFKKEQTPYEAFGESPDDYNYFDILQRAKSIDGNKWQRFLPEAMDKFIDENYMIARLLNDTRYISRVTVEYLSYIVGFKNIWTVRGNLTAQLRHEFGFNSILSEDNIKNRNDHRHHAVDALVVALTSRSLVQKFSKNEKRGDSHYVLTQGIPYPSLSYNQAKEKILDINTSFKPDHKANKGKITTSLGPLHKDTAYGYIGINPKDKDRILVSERKDILNIKNIKHIEKISNPQVRADLLELFNSSADFKKSLEKYSHENNIYKIKTIESKGIASTVQINIKNGSKIYTSGNNFCAHVFCHLHGKKAGTWEVEVISMFDRHQKDFIPNWRKQYSTAKKLMELFINDVVALVIDGNLEYRKVRKMTGTSIYLMKLNQSMSKTDAGECFSGTSLKTANARKISIDILGRVKDHQGRKYECLGNLPK